MNGSDQTNERLRHGRITNPSYASGFTLVELLVVIVIIAILAALLVPAVTGAISSAKEARMSLELSNLAKAIERYRVDNQAYPPDFSALTIDEDSLQIKNHMASLKRLRDWKLDSQTGSGTFNGLDPAEALVFWLRGFSSDPKRPITGAGDREPLYDFDQSRLSDADNDGYLEYYPKDSPGQPYVYFNSSTYAQAYAATNQLDKLGEKDAVKQNTYVRPYVRVTPPTTQEHFVDPEKFQIICAGLDQEFGTGGGVYPDGIGYTQADEDNLTSFSDGKTLEDAIP